MLGTIDSTFKVTVMRSNVSLPRFNISYIKFTQASAERINIGTDLRFD